MNNIDDSQMAVDSNTGLLIKEAYKTGFTTAMYLSTEIVSNANMEAAIVVPMIKWTSLQLISPAMPPNQRDCT